MALANDARRSSLADNALKILRTGRGRPDLSSLLSAGDVSQLALERWVIPRSERRPEYRLWRRESIKSLLGDVPTDVSRKVKMA